ncbi:hypothetical protein VZ95_06840 [Elstera litoralis]|uniref:Protease n=1 Tax=Elstera litoralis TaxID=552518 RepID=A0A0F3IU51_9PROT|nr:hypothetical protein [Elstera litoralis]KJV10152.1 hypothetical protein VZ95_06840 [Elstera litoralis]
MFQLAFILIGAKAFRGKWYIVAGLGVALILLGLFVAFGPPSHALLIAHALLGTLFLSNGILVALGGATAQDRSPLRAFLKSGGLVLMGGLVLIAAFWTPVALAVALGLALAVDGAFRITSTLVILFPGWRVVMLIGGIEILAAPMVALGWPLSYETAILLATGLMLALFGRFLLEFGLSFRTLPPEFSILNLPYFAGRGWYAHAPILVGDDDPEDQNRPPLTVYVWTPAGVATDPERTLLMDRYLAAVDKDGSYSTGHSALEVKPDLYISHYPSEELAIPENMNKLSSLQSLADTTQKGEFHDSYEGDVDWWCAADVRLEFPRYSYRRLLAFWLGYSQDSTYHLTNRNCSVVAAAGLDAALEGVLAGKRPWLRLLSLLLDPDLWGAVLARNRATAMTWTPGLFHDYARALGRVLQPTKMPWITRLKWFVYRARLSARTFGRKGKHA